MMNKTKLFGIGLLLASCFSLLAFVNNKNVSITPVSADEETKVVIQPKVETFKQLLRADKAAKFQIDTTNQTITNGGCWDANFFTSSDVDTTGKKFSLKAHVQSNYVGTLNDAWVGYALYFNNDNVVTFALQWGTQASQTINGAHFVGHVGGSAKTTDNFQTANISQNGNFARLPANPFVDVWADFGGWMEGTSPESAFTTNMFTNNSYVYLDKGFDMTLHVEKGEYRERECYILQYEIKAYQTVGSSFVDKTYFSPKVALDAFTYPYGNESPLRGLSPKLAFYNNNKCGDVVYSNFEFAKYVSESSEGAKFKPYGSVEPDKLEIDNTNKTVTLNNTTFNNGFAIANNIDYNIENEEYSAHVSGSAGVITEGAVGFTYYFDENNYIIAYSRWDSEACAKTINDISFLVTLNGVSQNVCGVFDYPWDEINGKNFHTLTEFHSYFTDSANVVTDSQIASGIDDNFNHFREQSAITVASGFDMGIRKIRKVYGEKLVDAFQFRISATGTDGKHHDWYTTILFTDAFTNPNGGATSAFIDTNPMIGFYSYGLGDVTFSNIKYGQKNLIPKDVSSYVFGSHVEGRWTLTGSDYGNNWIVESDNKLSVSYEDLDVGTHYGEVSALTSNTTKDFYMGANLTVSRIYGNSGYLALIPYYLDSNNFIAVYFERVYTNLVLVVTGKINGKYLGNQEFLYQETLIPNIFNGIYVEARLSGDYLYIYNEGTPNEYIHFNLSKEKIGERTLDGSYVGYGVYNANGTFSNINTCSENRIKPYTPTDKDLPLIAENGNRITMGYVGFVVNLPIYTGVNFVYDIIDCEITITSPSGKIKTLAKDEYTFTPEEEGEYTVKVNATDEWGHSASNAMEYKINVTNYVTVEDSTKKPYLWQTTFVLCFFGALILLTVALGIILVRKNKKEAEKAAALNKKNQERNEREFEGGDDNE